MPHSTGGGALQSAPAEGPQLDGNFPTPPNSKHLVLALTA
jgi:hypothetical protein